MREIIALHRHLAVATRVLADTARRVANAESMLAALAAVPKQLGRIEYRLDWLAYDVESICFKLSITETPPIPPDEVGLSMATVPPLGSGGEESEEDDVA